ncbi:hypothetical protein F5B20DRAFT_595472 [Whalleya microplaca]|nr:hypothetical protein F5B20DRAFT_595472 [Whalleya microplaca]
MKLNVLDRWTTPATMISTFLMGIISAISHDRFYESYNGQPVSTLLQQQLITIVGTTLAFLFRMFMTISTGAAFAQQLFHSLRITDESIGHLDMLFDLSNNALYLGNIRLWLSHPELLAIALMIWSLPLAAVFPPGAINVQPVVKYTNQTSPRPVQPQQSWHGSQKFASCQLDYTAMWKVNGDNDTYLDVLCNGPSSDLYSTTLSSVSQRNILPIPPPNLNSSYGLSFIGPALGCTVMSSTETKAVNTSAALAREHSYLPGMHTILGGVNGPESLVLRYNAWSHMSSIDNGSSCYNLTSPNWHNGTNSSNECSSAPNTNYFFLTSSSPAEDSIALIKCQLHNATYDVGFSFENSIQRVEVRSAELHESIMSNTTVDIDRPDYSNIVYTAMLDAMNNMVLGATLNDTAAGSTTSNLMYYDGLVGATALRDFIEGERRLIADDVRILLEQMFHNITISTMSSPALRLPEADKAEIVTTTWGSINGFASFNIFLCVCWGLFVIYYHHNQASYSMRFSTILRTTRSEQIATAVAPEGRKGEDPVSKDLLKIKLSLSHKKDDGNQDYGFQLSHDGLSEASVVMDEGQEASPMLQNRPSLLYHSQREVLLSTPVDSVSLDESSSGH